jgi:WD40 repeat protein
MHTTINEITLSILILISFLPLHSMENANKLTPPRQYYRGEINTSIKKPENIMYLNNDTVAIGGSNGLVFFDLKTNTLLKKYKTNVPTNDIAANNDRTLLTLSDHLNIKEYNTDTFYIKREASIPYSQAFIAYANDNHLLIYNSSTPHLGKIIIVTQDQPLPDFTFDGICICAIPRPVSYFSNNNSFLIQKDVGHCVMYSKNIQNLSNFIKYPTQDNTEIIGIECSKDGKYNVLNDKSKGISIYNTQTKSITSFTYYYNAKDNSYDAVRYPSMTFSSNNVLALLSWENTIQYCDCSINKVFDQTYLHPSQALKPQHSLTKRLSFSLDDTHIVVALENKCFVLPTPFKTKPLQIQTLFMIHLCWVLQNCQSIEISKDIIGVLIKNIVEII